MCVKLYMSWFFFSIKIVDKIYRYVKIKVLIFNFEKKINIVLSNMYV